jgi:peptidoglycan/xylan/chitin deacetylase (PgdA/CDA1 family)
MPLPDRAVWFYRQMTRRGRSQLLERLRQQSSMPIAILFYHRVAQTDCGNPWSISFDNFRRHLDWLQENSQLVSLAEAQKRIRSPRNDQWAVSITFDDGYAENADFAIPELVARRIPITYFVATDFVESGSGFPHDVQCGTPHLPNNLGQLKEFSGMGIELGAHTKSHADLGSITDPQHLREEIEGSIVKLRQWLAPVPCRYFAFPYGLPENMSQQAVDLLKELGIEAFCSAYGALNWPGNDGFHLRRIHGDPGMERLKNWLTLDTRKLKDPIKLPFDEPTPLLPKILASMEKKIPPLPR